MVTFQGIISRIWERKHFEYGIGAKANDRIMSSNELIPVNPKTPNFVIILSQNVCCHPSNTYLTVSGQGLTALLKMVCQGLAGKLPNPPPSLPGRLRGTLVYLLGGQRVGGGNSSEIHDNGFLLWHLAWG